MRISDWSSDVCSSDLLPFRELLEIPAANAKGGFAAVECYEMHARHVLRDPDAFDQRVLQRIRRAVEQSAVDYITLVRRRAEIQAACNAATEGFDAVVMPTDRKSTRLNSSH